MNKTTQKITVADAETGNMMLGQFVSIEEAIVFADSDPDINEIPLAVTVDGVDVYHTKYGNL